MVARKFDHVAYEDVATLRKFIGDPGLVVKARRSEQRDAAELLMRMIVSGADADAAIELRIFADGRPRQEFERDPVVAAFRAHLCASRPGQEVFVGCLPRHPVAAGQAPGGKAALRSGHVVWIELDSDEAIRALARFPVAPTFRIQSGGRTPEGRPKLHAWWFLLGALDPPGIERLNRRLAEALGGDARSTDAARVLRVPGCAYRKGGARAFTICTDVSEAVDLRALLAHLPPPPSPPPPRRTAPRPVRAGDDLREGLRSIEACEYVARLTGQHVEPGKIRCPLPGHEDRTPSFHVFEGDRGWACFGCGRSGDVFDLAAALWQLDRNRDFRALKARLGELFGLAHPIATGGSR